MQWSNQITWSYIMHRGRDPWGFRDQCVTSVRQVYIFLDGRKRLTGTLILTFDSPQVPSLVFARYLSMPVETYIPNPLRCFQHQKFGHHKTKCKHNIICARCSKKRQEGKSCALSEHWANCKGDHPAYSKDCPKWISEQEVKKIKSPRIISYAEARNHIIRFQNTSTSAQAYANKLTITTRSIETQTTLFFHTHDSMQIVTALRFSNTTFSTRSRTTPIHENRRRKQVKQQATTHTKITLQRNPATNNNDKAKRR